MALHGDNILQQLFPVRHSACCRTEIMAVYTLEYNSLAVKEHQPIFYLKFPEADFLLQHFCNIAASVSYFKPQVIKVRLLRAP